MMKKKKCPNCGEEYLEFVLGEWTCPRCEFHTRGGEPVKGTFR